MTQTEQKKEAKKSSNIIAGPFEMRLTVCICYSLFNRNNSRR